MNKFSRLIIFIVFIIIALVGFFFWRSGSSDSDQPRTITVEQGTVVQDLEFTGRLKSEHSIDLAFELSGTLQEVLIKEGEMVTIGQPLARLDPSAASLAADQAFADQASARQQQQLAWHKASTDAANITDANAKTIERYQQTVRNAKAEMDQAKEYHQQVSAEYGDTSTTESALSALKAKQSAYTSAQKLLEETIASTDQSNAAAAATAASAKAAYQATIQASGNQPGLSALEARLASARLQIDKNTLHAPFEGVITFKHKNTGETAAAHTPILTLENISDLEVEAGVTETDAAKLAVGQIAVINFDALPPTERWNATVSYISPAGRVIEGVATYTVRLKLTPTNRDLTIKPGFSANITVHADQRENVIAIPRRAVINQESEQFVLVLKPDGSTHRQAVSTGLAGSNGTIEITHGLSVDEQVIIDSRALREQP